MDKNSHFKVNTERPLKLVRMVVKPNGKKLENHYTFRYTGAQQVMT